jgi:hypothetical protein
VARRRTAALPGTATAARAAPNSDAPPYRGHPQARKEHFDGMRCHVTEIGKGRLRVHFPITGETWIWMERDRTGWFEETELEATV